MICRSYRTVCTLPVSTMLRAAQATQDGGNERLQQQAEDDDQDESQSIFHNLKLFSFPSFHLSAPGTVMSFLHTEGGRP